MRALPVPVLNIGNRGEVVSKHGFGSDERREGASAPLHTPYLYISARHGKSAPLLKDIGAKALTFTLGFGGVAACLGIVCAVRKFGHVALCLAFFFIIG